jgi:hypothetical protein
MLFKVRQLIAASLFMAISLIAITGLPLQAVASGKGQKPMVLKEGKRFPLCRELTDILNRPENAETWPGTLGTYKFKGVDGKYYDREYTNINPEIKFPKTSKFRAVQWEPITKEENKLCYGDERTWTENYFKFDEKKRKIYAYKAIINIDHYLGKEYIIRRVGQSSQIDSRYWRAYLEPCRKKDEDFWTAYTKDSYYLHLSNAFYYDGKIRAYEWFGSEPMLVYDVIPMINTYQLPPGSTPPPYQIYNQPICKIMRTQP